MTGFLAPQQLVHLHLHAHVETIGEDPFGKFARRKPTMHRRQQDLAPRGERVFANTCAGPVVISTIGEHDLDLIVCRQMREIRPQVARAFA